MKIGPEAGPEVPLPIEVVQVIVDIVARIIEDRQQRQTTLWALCLVNRSWYAAGINHLYSWPALGSKNFQLFTRTICPPVSSRARATGLEDLVESIDMRDMAYLSSKSTTAKLLRRTKKSLQTFVAPSHSMSISSLAPISKLSAIQFLDLSRDKYDFSLKQLLKAVQPLDHLVYLSLPRGAIDDYDPEETASSWPSALRTLQVNSSVPPLEIQRQRFFSSFHRKLSELNFRYIQNWRQATLLFIGDLHHIAPSIHKFAISDVGGETLFREEFNLADVVDVFPELQMLELPITALHFTELLTRSEIWKQSKLGELITHEVPYERKLGNEQAEVLLTDLARGFESLYKVQLPTGHCRSGMGIYDFEIPHQILCQCHREDLNVQLKGIFIANDSGRIERWRSDMNPRLFQG
jgi:hypothetical protein